MAEFSQNDRRRLLSALPEVTPAAANGTEIATHFGVRCAALRIL